MPTRYEPLLPRVAAGDEEAFVQFVETHLESIRRYVRCHLRDAQQVDDCVQDTLLTALERASSFEGRSSEQTWVLGVARYKVLGRIQNKQRSREVPCDLEVLGERAGWGAGQIEASYDLHRVQDALDELSEELAEIVVLRDMEGFTTREAAELLDLSEPAVKSRLHRARLQLMAALRDGD